MKRMILTFAAISLLALITGNATAGYGHYYNSEFRNAALRLDQSARGFVEQVSYRYGRYSREYELARHFSRGASHYCDLVARGRDLGRLREVFDELQRRYYRLEQFAGSLAGYHGRGYRNDGLGFYRLSVAFTGATGALRQELARRGHHGGYKYRHNSYEYGYYDDRHHSPHTGGRKQAPLYGSDQGYRRERDIQRQR